MSNPRKGIPNRSHVQRHTADDIAWMADANCRGIDSDMFFPEHAAHIDPATKKVCDVCEVRKQCLEHALLHGEWAGVWGGKSVQQRRDIARRLGIKEYKI